MILTHSVVLSICQISLTFFAFLISLIRFIALVKRLATDSFTQHTSVSTIKLMLVLGRHRIFKRISRFKNLRLLPTHASIFRERHEFVISSLLVLKIIFALHLSKIAKLSSHFSIQGICMVPMIADIFCMNGHR